MRKSRFIPLLFLLSIIALTCSTADMVNTVDTKATSDEDTIVLITTEKATYLMDPYYWVYDAPDDIWPGYDRTVNFTVMVLDNRGFLVQDAIVNYCVYDDIDIKIAEENNIPETRFGFYASSFDITDTDAGGEDFIGDVPKSFSIIVNVTHNGMDPVENVKKITIGRWGCDRCHLGYTGWAGFRNPKVKELYPWSEFPELGPGGPHNWKNILGYNGADKNVFNISYLTNSKLTHTSPDYHANYPYHEKTAMKMPDSLNCTPCHQGSGRVRYNYSLGDDNLWLPHAKGQAVECTFCHGMDGGYTSYWPNSTGYTYGEHSKVAPPPDEPADPYLAHQTCSNVSCHGHISNSKPGAIDNAYPTCSDCHPVSFGSDVVQWLNTSTGQPRDVGGHPGETGHCSSCGDVDNNTILNILDVRLLMNYISDPVGYPINESLGDVDGNSIINSGDVQLLLNHIFNPDVYPLNCICEQASEEGIVNCSFCHNSFHSIFDESNVLRCNDCHSQSDNYPMVHWNFFN